MNLNKPVILVIEDSLTNLALAKAILQPKGFQVLSAKNGEKKRRPGTIAREGDCPARFRRCAGGPRECARNTQWSCVGQAEARTQNRPGTAHRKLGVVQRCSVRFGFYLGAFNWAALPQSVQSRHLLGQYLPPVLFPELFKIFFGRRYR